MPLDFLTLSLPLAIGIFIACALIIGTAGTYLAGVADRLADRTGLGEAIAGAILLGATTSLPGIVVSVSSAWQGQPELAMSNALGGIAVQTAFLALADLTYRRANLEHAAPSIGNLMQSGLLVCLLALLLVGVYTPPVTFFGVHPVTPLLFAGYLYGLAKVRSAQQHPMWSPTQTKETFADEPPASPSQESLSGLWLRFVLLAAVLAVTGLVLERAATVIGDETGLSATAVGALLTAVVTSLPELVTSIAAVRRGALTLAVSGIIGGNAFDTLFVAASDIAYRDGSIYHAVSNQVLLWIAITIVMTGVMMLGLIRREEQNWGGIGFESAIILMLYALGGVLVMI